MFSRVTKQRQIALGRENDETRCSGPEKIALLVFLVGKKFLKERQTYMAGTKPVTSKQIRGVKKQRGPASGKLDNNRNTGGFENIRSSPLYPLQKSRNKLRSQGQQLVVGLR